jgi:DNA-binding GntR family transcriptional regulator
MASAISGSAAETYRALASQREQLDRAGLSTQVADIVRSRILDGQFRPGTRLSEPDICAALKVSRNTVREAFRTLMQERLVAHELNRGVFVRIPRPEDVSEVYKCRRVVECTALREHPRTGTDLAPLAASLERADHCAAQDDWTGVGTADVDFHRAITALNDSRLLDAMMAGVWNELRLIFHVVAHPDVFHGPYLRRNHEVFEALGRGAAAEAADMLADYLSDAQAQILAAYAEIDTDF